MRPRILPLTALPLGCALGWLLHAWCEPVVYLPPEPTQSSPLVSRGSTWDNDRDLEVTLATARADLEADLREARS